ncbi:hypothetical protein [Microlunatus parietis]|uniref:Uncharacterized protein n=1 Tax=Microlunatus parietis TaxID=682979 RepID=A0A7Y9I8C6_9ACTN|nr:hypothetical protein [Microlunatus parietis]NYE71888.1 hypothetical protein [Microlunatus parietis]
MTEFDQGTAAEWSSPEEYRTAWGAAFTQLAWQGQTEESRAHYARLAGEVDRMATESWSTGEILSQSGIWQRVERIHREDDPPATNAEALVGLAAAVDAGEMTIFEPTSGPEDGLDAETVLADLARQISGRADRDRIVAERRAAGLPDGAAHNARARADLAAALTEVSSEMTRAAETERRARIAAGFEGIESPFEWRIHRGLLHASAAAGLQQTYEESLTGEGSGGDRVPGTTDWVAPLSAESIATVTAELRRYADYRRNTGDSDTEFDGAPWWSEDEAATVREAAWARLAEQAAAFDELADNIDHDGEAMLSPVNVALLGEAFSEALWESTRGDGDHTPRHLRPFVAAVEQEAKRIDEHQRLEMEIETAVSDEHRDQLIMLDAHKEAAAAAGRARFALDQLVTDHAYDPVREPHVWRELDDRLDRLGTSLRVNTAELSSPDFRELVHSDWLHAAEARETAAAEAMTDDSATGSEVASDDHDADTRTGEDDRAEADRPVATPYGVGRIAEAFYGLDADASTPAEGYRVRIDATGAEKFIKAEHVSTDPDKIAKSGLQARYSDGAPVQITHDGFILDEHEVCNDDWDQPYWYRIPQRNTTARQDLAAALFDADTALGRAEEIEDQVREAAGYDDVTSEFALEIDFARGDVQRAIALQRLLEGTHTAPPTEDQADDDADGDQSPIAEANAAEPPAVDAELGEDGHSLGAHRDADAALDRARFAFTALLGSDDDYADWDRADATPTNVDELGDLIGQAQAMTRSNLNDLQTPGVDDRIRADWEEQDQATRGLVPDQAGADGAHVDDDPSWWSEPDAETAVEIDRLIAIVGRGEAVQHRREAMPPDAPNYDLWRDLRTELAADAGDSTATPTAEHHDGDQDVDDDAVTPDFDERPATEPPDPTAEAVQRAEEAVHDLQRQTEEHRRTAAERARHDDDLARWHQQDQQQHAGAIEHTDSGPALDRADLGDR